MARIEGRPVGARRHGSGTVIFMVASVLIVLVVMAIAMGTRTENIVAQSRKAIFHERAQDLADMAIKEAVHYLRIQANNPDATAFELFRAQSGGAELTFDDDALPYTKAEVARMPGYSLGYGVEVTVLRRAAIGILQEERVPYVAVGVVRFDATVDGPSGTRVTQRDEFGFRSILTAPPRPFDMCTFFLLDPADLLNQTALNGDVNFTISNMVDQLRDFKTRFAKLADDLEDAQGQIPNAQGGAQVKAKLGEMVQILRDGIGPRWKAKDWKYLPANGGNTTGVEATLHLFDWPICVFSIDDQVELAALDVPNLTREPNSEYLRNQDEVRRLSEEFEQLRQQLANSTNPSDLDRVVELVRRMVDAAVVVGEHADRSLDAYKLFQDLLVEVGGAALEDLQNRARRFSVDEQPWKSHYRFEGPKAVERAMEFINQDPPPAGAVYIRPDEVDATVRLNIAGLTGRLSIVSTADVVVENAWVQDPDRDLLVIVGYGQIEVNGAARVDASIVSWSGGFQGVGKDFTGSLVLDTIPPSAPTDTILAGTLTRGGSVLSGPPGNQERPPPDPTSLHIALGPVAPYHKVYHQR